MECVQCMAYNNSLVHYTFLLQHLCGGEVDMAQAAHTCSHTHTLLLLAMEGTYLLAAIFSDRCII